MLVHSVFFWLKPDLTEAQRAEFRRGLESLTVIRAAEALYIGTPAATPARPTIDTTYSFALTVVFRDVASHDAYQTDPIHRAFGEKFRGFWSRLQVYDAA
ncbi:MAG TPA: Dabb family protein [Opitutaceae bacterium]|nr:Dabb family protein [Opitutaceae bacterium]